MNARTKGIMGALALVVTLAILIFAFPGIIGMDPHLRADKTFLQGLNCEFKQDYDCALVQYQAAIAIYGGDSHYYTHLAQIQRKQGDYSSAIETYQKAKEINPSDENVLPGINKAISQQATQTAVPLPISPEVKTENQTLTPAPALPASIYPVFDEDFGIVEDVTAETGSAEDHILYEIVDDESYSGKYSLLITWNKTQYHWASVVLHFDNQNDPTRAAAGQMASLNLSPRSDYAIEFFAKRGESSTRNSGQAGSLMDQSITLKFQDQNVLIEESIGNQAVYVYDYDSKTQVLDGRLKLNDADWQQFCLPLEKFKTDWWVEQSYRDYTEADRQFDWANVKQINIDADFISAAGAVYIDALRIIRA